MPSKPSEQIGRSLDVGIQLARVTLALSELAPQHLHPRGEIGVVGRAAREEVGGICRRTEHLPGAREDVRAALASRGHERGVHVRRVFHVHVHEGVQPVRAVSPEVQQPLEPDHVLRPSRERRDLDDRRRLDRSFLDSIALRTGAVPEATRALETMGERPRDAVHGESDRENGQHRACGHAANVRIVRYPSATVSSNRRTKRSAAGRQTCRCCGARSQALLAHVAALDANAKQRRYVARRRLRDELAHCA